MIEECCSLVDLYTGIRNGSIEVQSTSSRPFEFPETFKEQPFSVVVASKQSGLFQPCNLPEVCRVSQGFKCEMGMSLIIKLRSTAHPGIHACIKGRLNFLINRSPSSSSADIASARYLVYVQCGCGTHLKCWGNTYPQCPPVPMPMLHKKLKRFVESSLISYSLTFCSLSDNHISDKGAHALSEALQVNQSLEDLE